MSLNFDKTLRMLSARPASIQYLSSSLLSEKDVRLAILRLDEVHPLVSGNKFFKLKYNLDEARKRGKDTVLTFGGAYSNHIFATASAASTEGLKSIGIIRGEDGDLNNPTLLHAREMGMQLHFVDRERYRNKTSPEFHRQLQSLVGDCYLIPEGGTNGLAIVGTKEILTEAHSGFSHICVSIGTGGTFAGLSGSVHPDQSLLGFSSLKGEFIRKEMDDLISLHQVIPRGALEIRTDYHFGGYAKVKPELIDFIRWFYSQFQIPLDPIYTGKMAYGVWDLIQQNHFPSGAHILMIHTGGLQGNAGFFTQTGIELPIT
jgi:1-aminocyclopropane-1-carboxylate deaminase